MIRSKQLQQLLVVERFNFLVIAQASRTTTETELDALYNVYFKGEFFLTL